MKISRRHPSSTKFFGRFSNRVFSIRLLAALAVLILVSIIGVSLLRSSHASTAAISAEPEAGTLSGNAARVSDATASGGSAIRFSAVTPPPPGTPRNLNDRGVGFSVPYLPYQTQADQTKWLSDIKSMGASWIRTDIWWSRVQASSAPNYNWTMYDTAVSSANAAGLKVDLIIDATPTWAGIPACAGKLNCQPADPNAYASFAAAVVQHYGTKIGSVEIWNEPNIYQFWTPLPDPVAYTKMLIAADAAIKKVDPQMLVLSAGLSRAANTADKAYISPVTYLQAMYANGAHGSFDVFASHPYSYPLPPQDPNLVANAWNELSVKTTSLRSTMIANGDGAKPTWVTEYGAATGGPAGTTGTATCANYDQPASLYYHQVDECLQSLSLTQAITCTKNNSYLGVLFLYSYKDDGTATNTIQNFFGVVRADYSHKQSYDAVKQAIANFNTTDKTCT